MRPYFGIGVRLSARTLVRLVIYIIWAAVALIIALGCGSCILISSLFMQHMR